MSETALEDFLILRDLDEPIPERAFDAAAGGAGEVLWDLNDEGVGIRWVKPDVRTRPDGAVVGTFRHYRAESEGALREHAARAGLPVTRIDLRGETLESERTRVDGTERRAETAGTTGNTNEGETDYGG